MFVKDSRYSGNGNSYCYSLPPLPPYLHFPNPSRYRYAQTCLAALHSRTTMIVQAQTIFHNGHSPSIPGFSSPSIAQGIFWIDVVNNSAQFIPVHWLLFGLFLAPAPSPVLIIPFPQGHPGLYNSMEVPWTCCSVSDTYRSHVQFSLPGKSPRPSLFLPVLIFQSLSKAISSSPVEVASFLLLS